MSVAALAQHFHALHEQAGVLVRANIFLRDRSPEARPASSGIKLGFRPEQRILTADTGKNAPSVDLIVSSRKGYIGASLTSHRILLAAELLPPLGACVHNALHMRRPQIFA